MIECVISILNLYQPLRALWLDSNIYAKDINKIWAFRMQTATWKTDEEIIRRNISTELEAINHQCFLKKNRITINNVLCFHLILPSYSLCFHLIRPINMETNIGMIGQQRHYIYSVVQYSIHKVDTNISISWSSCNEFMYYWDIHNTTKNKQSQGYIYI